MTGTDCDLRVIVDGDDLLPTLLFEFQTTPDVKTYSGTYRLKDFVFDEWHQVSNAFSDVCFVCLLLLTNFLLLTLALCNESTNSFCYCFVVGDFV